MAFGDRKGRGDMVLESRHLVGIFLFIVVVSTVVFTLGYLLGRNQAQTPDPLANNKEMSRAPSSRSPAMPGPASATKSASPAATTPPPSASSEWDFYRSAEPKKTARLENPGRAREVSSKAPLQPASLRKPASRKRNGLLAAPPMPKGAIVLQVAALTKEGDALALAEALQVKKFPAFVLTPGADHYYRVQVGPYADGQSADLTRRKLESEGFKAIAKR